VRIESVTAQAFGPLAGETLELAPGLTVVSGVNESAKSSWHAALYAALCGRSRGVVAPTPEDRRLLERYKPWDGSPWLVSAMVVLDDGRRLEICQDLDGTSPGTVVEIGDEDGDGTVSRTDVTSEILTAGGPDASRWLGLDRSAFGAVALVNQAEHRAVRDVAHGLQQYLLRAAESARTGGSAGPALAALDRFQQERLGREAGNPLLLAQERVRLAREARVVARRGQEQYLAGLAAACRRRSSTAESTSRLHAAEGTVNGLEALRDAARAADEARAAAERSRAELASVTAACEAAAARSVRGAAVQMPVPEQNSGVVDVAPVPDETALLDEVDSARRAWDSRPVPPPLDGPCTRQLRRELAALPEGADPEVRRLAQQHQDALDAAAVPPTPRPVPRPSPAPPAELRRVADVLSAPVARLAGPAADGSDLAQLASDVDAAETRQRDTAAAAQMAEQDAAAAAERYEQMRAAAPTAASRKSGKGRGRVKALALTVLGVGVGLAALYFGLLAALVLSAIVILPVVVSLLAAVVLVVRSMRKPGRKPGQPLVEDLVGAIVIVREKKAAAARAQEEARKAEEHLTECRARHAAAQRGEQPDPAREQALEWCTQHGLRADPAALRALADRSEQQSAWQDADRSRLAAAVARTGDELRAALRERGILDEGSPLEQFARYEERAGGASGRRAELERALAARIAAEETAAEVVAARRDAVARLRSAAGAAGLDASGEPEALVAALDGWRTTRSARGAVALAERPRTAIDAPSHGAGRHAFAGPGTAPATSGPDRVRLVALDPPGTSVVAAGERATLLDSGSPDDLRRREEALRAERDERLTQAWAADLAACEARRRRDELATAAGIDPVRAGDRFHVTALLEVARAEVRRARAALEEQPAQALVPADGPHVAHADEEVEAAEAELRRIEQLRRTTALTRRFLARAQEQAHQDLAPVLAATLRSWLPAVTGGRYVDATVDPETLAIQVYGKGGRWRSVDRLSAGTTDQVYLLLRVALAQHLATTGETCPLLLDGVTAQSDDERTREILDLLLRLAAERQVVLFTQEETVLRWAREHLDGDRHRVRELTRLPVA
jgi:hypothetical protein